VPVPPVDPLDPIDPIVDPEGPDDANSGIAGGCAVASRGGGCPTGGCAGFALLLGCAILGWRVASRRRK
jgi:hypothetical protein